MSSEFHKETKAPGTRGAGDMRKVCQMLGKDYEKSSEEDDFLVGVENLSLRRKSTNRWKFISLPSSAVV